MRYFLDSEFIDTGSLIDLISIALVCEDGRELHLQSSEFDAWSASRWVKEHVFPHLAFCPHLKRDTDEPVLTHDLAEHYGQLDADIHPGCLWRTRDQIRDEVAAFCDPKQYGTPEMWGWCAAYDFVALCQLFGTMMDLPQGYPHYIRDVQYLLDEMSIADCSLEAMLPVPGTAHNALDDARYIRDIWKLLAPGAPRYTPDRTEGQ